MKTSTLGIKAIAKREGTVLHVYKDSKGLWTAGVGHLLDESERKQFPLGTKITQQQSDKWLAADLQECEEAVNSLGVNLAQNEFDALVSLAFNIGVVGFRRSTVARRLKAGDKKGAAEAILLWDKPPEIQGRRRTEYNQFKTPYQVPEFPADSTPEPARESSVLPTAKPIAAPQPAPASGTETTEVKATETATGTATVAVTQKNEQDVNAPAEIAAPKPQGVFSKMAAGIGTLLGGTLLYTVLEKIGAMSFTNRSLILIGFVAVLGFFGACFYFWLDAWKQNNRVKIEAEANTAIDRKDIRWV